MVKIFRKPAEKRKNGKNRVLKRCSIKTVLNSYNLTEKIMFKTFCLKSKLVYYFRTDFHKTGTLYARSRTLLSYRLS